MSVTENYVGTPNKLAELYSFRAKNFQELKWIDTGVERHFLIKDEFDVSTCTTHFLLYKSQKLVCSIRCICKKPDGNFPFHQLGFKKEDFNATGKLHLCEFSRLCTMSVSPPKNNSLLVLATVSFAAQFYKEKTKDEIQFCAVGGARMESFITKAGMKKTGVQREYDRNPGGLVQSLEQGVAFESNTTLMPRFDYKDLLAHDNFSVFIIEGAKIK